MFSKSFYPTPDTVIRAMIAPYLDDMQERGYSILDPSAGKGNILDFIRNRNRHAKLYAIEQNQELQMILHEKNYRLLGSDFLEYHGDMFFDLIIMNPPFESGTKHLLHAWDVLKNGHIVCLLNAETLANPYTEERKLLLKIISEHGSSIEMLGDCFAEGAERSTDVNVAMVRLTKKSQTILDFAEGSFTREKNFDISEETFSSQIMTNDVIGNMIIQFENLKKVFVGYVKEHERMEFYSKGLVKEGVVREIANRSLSENHSKQGAYNMFSDEVRNSMWDIVMSKLNVDRYLTNQVKQSFSQFRQQQGAMDFTKENVLALVELIVGNRSMLMDKAIVEVFDIFTRYHDQNRCHVEGWKTNDRWKVNRKIILPYFVKMGYGKNYSVDVHRWDAYSDIDKVMCYLTGKNLDTIMTLRETVENTPYGDSGKKESEFFWIRSYQKGTLHMEFKDKFLWQEFNMRACDGKQWLPAEERDKWKQRNHSPKQL